MTLPADLYELPTLAAWLKANSREADPLYQCPACPRTFPPEGIVSTTGLPGVTNAWLCHTCASGPFRHAHQLVLEAERAGAGPDWTAVRSTRNALLANSDWRMVPDSPLDEPTRAAWAAYRQQLREVTDAGHPDAVVWPDPPN